MKKVIRETLLAGGFCQAPGAIVLVELSDNEMHPYVTWFRNDEDTLINGRPCYYSGEYCKTLVDAEHSFKERVQRYDPTGQLRDARAAGYYRLSDRVAA